MTGKRRSKTTIGILVITALSVSSMAGCPAAAPVIGFTIAARTFVFVLETAGRISARANAAQPARTGGVVTLPFDDQPVDRPGSARLNLNVGTTRALPIDGAAKALANQSINGTATLRVRIAGESSANPCDDGVDVGTFALSFAGGAVSATSSSLELPGAALDFVRSGVFTICLELTTTVDVTLVVESMEVEFGPDASEMPGDGPDDTPNGPDVTPSDTPTDTPTDTPGEMPDGTPNDGDPMDDPADDHPLGGLIPAIILHSGAEQIIAGPDIDPSCGMVYSDDYTVSNYVFDQYNDSIALSGFGTRVWFRLQAPFAIEGQPRTQLWSINIDGTGASRSLLPDDDLLAGIHIRTTEDGNTCIANNPRGKFYSATVGKAATELLDYTGLYDIRHGFDINNDATRVYMIDRSHATMRMMNTTIIPHAANLLLEPANLPIQGVFPRGLSVDELDVAGDQSRYVFRANYSSSALTPSTQDVLFYGEGFVGPTVEIVEQQPAGDTVSDLNITDNGMAIAYCYDSDGIDSPNECVVEAADGSSRTIVGDGRTHVGGLVLSDSGNRVYYSTSRCCSSNDGIFEDVATGQKLPAGTQVFSGGQATERSYARLSDDGKTLVAASSHGVYVLQDGKGLLPGFPSIDAIGYKFETQGEDCKLIVRVSASSMNGIERIFVNPHIDGVDPTVFVPGEENPFYSIRLGGGVNMSTTFEPVEGYAGVYEKEIPLTNSRNECAVEHLTHEYRLRIIVIDGTGCRTVFQDFDPTM